VIAGGVLTDADGGSLDGAEINLLVSPAEENQAKAQIGEKLNTPIVALTKSADGHFVLREPKSGIGEEFLGADRTVDFSALVISDGKFVVYRFSRRFDPDRGWVAPAGSLETEDSKSATADSSLVISFAGATSSDRMRPTGPEDEVAGPVGTQRGCSSTQIAYHADQTTAIATIDTQNNARALVTYSTGTSNELGAGYSAGGGYGTYSQSGTLSKSTNVSIAFGGYNTANVHKQIAVGWDFKNIFWECTFTSAPYYTAWNTEDPYYGGTSDKSWDKAAETSTSYCGSWGAGTTYTVNNSTNVTWSNGIAIPALGLTLSSKSGWTTGTSTSFYFTGNGEICHSTSNGGRYWQRDTK
jgi:hypothetical protein